MQVEIERTQHWAETEDGWRLSLRRVVDPGNFDPKAKPLVIVPGYGMNSFIFGYHPTGASMEEYFSRRGFEVWSVDLRGQGKSHREVGRGRYGLRELALTDLAAVLEFVSEHTASSAETSHVIGCSLGGSLLYAHLACRASKRVATAVAIGAPLRWVRVHPLLRAAFSSPRLAGALPHRGVRRLASIVFPLALKLPKMLHIYMHPEISDCSDYKTLLNTVEDTSPPVNRQLARWVRATDLQVGGRDIPTGLRDVDVPLLCILANADGIVPEDSAMSVMPVWGSADKQVLRVGDKHRHFAHADLFISRYSEDLVFKPIADWCSAR